MRFSTTQFSKKFFRLRRRDVKQRTTGYYYVLWSYNGTNRPDWRIGYYSDGVGWILPGDSRKFDDQDFIRIDRTKITGFPWNVTTKLLYVISVVCLIATIIIDIINTERFIHLMHKLCK